jgi:hypothetical protein
MLALSEFEIVQNDALASTLLWVFANQYADASPTGEGPLLPIVMVVLPICFHRESVETLHSRNFNGGLFRALAEGMDVPVGLQYRMERMAGQTCRALYAGVASGLLTYDPHSSRVGATRRTLPMDVNVDGVKALVATAKRLGAWFALLSDEQICVAIKVRF